MDKKILVLIFYNSHTQLLTVGYHENKNSTVL